MSPKKCHLLRTLQLKHLNLQFYVAWRFHHWKQINHRSYPTSLYSLYVFQSQFQLSFVILNVSVSYNRMLCSDNLYYYCNVWCMYWDWLFYFFVGCYWSSSTASIQDFKEELLMNQDYHKLKNSFIYYNFMLMSLAIKCFIFFYIIGYIHY